MKVEKSYRLHFLPEHVRQSTGLTIDSLSLNQESKRRQNATARQSQIETKYSERVRPLLEKQGEGGGAMWQSRSKRVVFFLTLGLIAKALGKSKSSTSMRVAMVMVAAILMD